MARSITSWRGHTVLVAIGTCVRIDGRRYVRCGGFDRACASKGVVIASTASPSHTTTARITASSSPPQYAELPSVFQARAPASERKNLPTGSPGDGHGGRG